MARETAKGTRFDPAEALMRDEAIRLYTTGAAFAMREEASRGSIEAGKLADFTVLDRDILSCPVDEIRTIRPRRTIVGGVDVYTA